MASIYALLVAGLVVYVTYRMLKQPAGLVPPGPPRYPIIGSALSMPSESMWLTFTEWQKTYGDMVYMEALGRPILILNKRVDAMALMDKKADVYSDRPRLEMIGEMCGAARTWVMTPLGSWFRRQKKVLAKALTPVSIARYAPIQVDSARRFTTELLQSQESLKKGSLDSHIEMAMARIMFLMMYSYEVGSIQDECVAATVRAARGFSEISTQVWLVDVFPFLRYIPRWLPGFTFPKVAAKYWANTDVAVWSPYNLFKKQYNEASASGNDLNVPSVCETIYSDVDGNISKDTEEALVWGAHSLIAGGMDTSIGSLHSFFLLMLHNPDVLAKAQKEIDRVVGDDRLPTLEDRPNLPYVRSVITEVLRYAPPIPLVIPHATTQDDTYKGYTFKKGTMTFCNVWNMLRDPEEYPNPEVFDPERYGGNDVAMQAVTALIFGFGKRSCPGRRMAEGTLFLFVTTVLSMCDVRPVADEKGNRVIPEEKFTTGALPKPLTFNCDITPRKSLDLLL